MPDTTSRKTYVPSPDATVQGPTVRGTAKRRASTTSSQSFTDVSPAVKLARPVVDANQSELFPRQTAPQPAITAAQPTVKEALTGPATLNLPVIPRSTNTRPVPAVRPTTTPIRTVQKISKEQERALDACSTTLIPGTLRHDQIWQGVPQLHPRSRARTHRLVAVGAMAILLVVALTIVPLARAGSPMGAWISNSNAFALPTATATPPTIYYPLRPNVGGVGSFICTALPFARLAQRKQLENGMAHPWYVSVILAQWGVEQGYHMPTYTGYNFGNVSAIAGFPSVGGINVPGSPGAFAYANTTLQGVDEYVIFTGNYHFYYNIMANYPNGPRAQALALGQSPWDADHYGINGYAGAKLLNALNSYNLYRFDNPSVWC